MHKNTEKVELTVLNNHGVLGRVVGHIRHEGWNIKRLHVDETEDEKISRMVIEIEGTHTKLALVVDHFLQLDSVISVSMENNGSPVTRTRKIKETHGINEDAVNDIAIPDKKEEIIRILVINPGSTSTKFAVYDDDKPIMEKTIRHEQEVLNACGTILGQKELRMNCILKELENNSLSLKTIDAIAGRGGLLKPIESGTYRINREMLEDLQTATASIHASALGAVIAGEISDRLSVPAYVVDPIVVDEMDRNAKLTGIPGIERSSVFHALNQKATARRYAKEHGVSYENLRLIVAHLGGGITVGAHRYGRVIDVNDALSGEGPFTPERSGGIPATPLIKMCFSGEYTEAEMNEKIVKKGGMQAYLGTNDLKKVQRMISSGDEFAALVLDSMAYQVSKEIGAMTAVLEGAADAIILTGGLAYSNRFTGAIKQRVDRLAPVHVFPGEDEMPALVEGVLRVLRDGITAAEYE